MPAVPCARRELAAHGELAPDELHRIEAQTLEDVIEPAAAELLSAREVSCVPG